MGERKGQNHYYPPDFNWKTHKTLNAYHGVHALRERGKRAHEGILTIRFEMPFNIWCLGCKNHVGMSVRYNAEKKKVGMYYTTPIYEFRMKCHLCDNYFTIRTDPKNFDYELVEGLRRQEIRFDPSTIDNLAPVDRTMSLKLASDAMFKAEHVVDDKQKLASDDQQIEKLEWIQSRCRDDYRTNSLLRSTFRNEKRALTERRARDQNMKERLSTEIALLPETEADRIAAKRLALSKHLSVHPNRTETLTKEKVLTSPISFRCESNACTSSSANAPSEHDVRQMLVRKLRNGAIENALTNSTAGRNEGIKRSCKMLGIVEKDDRRKYNQSIENGELSQCCSSDDYTGEQKAPCGETATSPSALLGLTVYNGGSSCSEGEEMDLEK